MNVFVAGASGAIGVPLVRRLIAAGHQVTALTRSPANVEMLRTLGASPAVADALDADALRRVVVGAHPMHVIHQLTALPKRGAKSAKDLAPTTACAPKALGTCSPRRSRPARSESSAVRSRSSAPPRKAFPRN